MRLTEYRKLRRGLQRNAAPVAPATQQSVAARLLTALEASDLFDTVEVGCTEDHDRLVIALVTVRAGSVLDDVAAGLERLWRDRVGFPFWQAHATTVDRDQVELQAAARESSTGGFVSLHVVAQVAQPALAPAAGVTAQPSARDRGVVRHLSLAPAAPVEPALENVVEVVDADSVRRPLLTWARWGRAAA